MNLFNQWMLVSHDEVDVGNERSSEHRTDLCFCLHGVDLVQHGFAVTTK